jgi:hypothetical protein
MTLTKANFALSSNSSDDEFVIEENPMDQLTHTELLVAKSSARIHK